MKEAVAKAVRDKPVIIYDGSCNICAGNLKWLRRLDLFKKFDAMPYQAEDLTAQFPDLDIAGCEKTMHLVFPSGRTYTGADAFREIFLRMPLTFVLGVAMCLPPVGWTLRRLYPMLARNRYRIGGSCALPARDARKDDPAQFRGAGFR